MAPGNLLTEVYPVADYSTVEVELLSLRARRTTRNDDSVDTGTFDILPDLCGAFVAAKEFMRPAQLCLALFHRDALEAFNIKRFADRTTGADIDSDTLIHFWPLPQPAMPSVRPQLHPAPLPTPPLVA